jgi:peptide deformylase
MVNNSDFVQYDSFLGKDILYKPSKKVTDISSTKIQKIILEMKDKMMGNGIGLAANQISYPLQIFMISYTNNKNSSFYSSRYKTPLPSVPFQVFINPIITKASAELVSFWHGCLSASTHPLGKVSTYKEIEYKAYNPQGEKISGSLDNLAAVIFQHEFRHLLGKLYLDYSKDFMKRSKFEQKIISEEINAYETCDQTVPHLLEDYKIGTAI